MKGSINLLGVIAFIFKNTKFYLIINVCSCDTVINK